MTIIFNIMKYLAVIVGINKGLGIDLPIEQHLIVLGCILVYDVSDFCENAIHFKFKG